MDSNILSIAGAAYGQQVTKPQQPVRRSADAEAPRAPEKPSGPAAGAGDLKPLADPSSKKAQLVVHEATKRVIIKVTDGSTGQIVTEIPPEKYLDMVAKFLQTVDLNGGNIDATM